MNTRSFGVHRPRTIGTATRALVTALVTALVVSGLSALVLSPATAAPTRSVATSASASSAADTYEHRVKRQVNKRRARHGLRRLRLASCPDSTAAGWSRHLASSDSFYHQSMVDILDECDAEYAGETLGRGTMSPRKLVRMWMNSPAHRAVLISTKSRRIGIGATPDAYGRWVVAANFVRF